MRPNRLFFYLALLGIFVVFTAQAAWEHSYLELWAFTMKGSAHRQIFADLFIACVLFSSWMVGDARARKKRAWPFLLLTVATGSLGLLAYMIWREVSRGKEAAA
jgi:hypothetical protein